MKTWVRGHGERILTRFERDIFPWIGARPIADLTAPELLTTVRRIEKRGALETAHRALGNCGQVFRYAIATGRAKRDPTGDLRGALPAVRPTHFAAITDPKRVGALLRAIDGYEGSLTVRCALRLAPLVFVRPGELRQAERLGFKPGPREVEEEADGYLYRAELQLHQARGSRDDALRRLRLAADDLARARSLYEPVYDFSNVAQNLKRLEDDQSSVDKLRSGIEHPPAPVSRSRRARRR